MSITKKTLLLHKTYQILHKTYHLVHKNISLPSERKHINYYIIGVFVLDDND